MTVLAAATMLTACSRPSRDVPETRTRAPTVEERATRSPLDLMVDLSTEDWIAGLNGGAGVEVTPANWAEAFAIDEEVAATAAAAAERDGLAAIATETWDFRLAPSTTQRLTIGQYASLQAVEDPWWAAILSTGDRPDGLVVPQGMQLGCAPAYDPETRASRVDAGGYHADCVVTIGDAVTVQVSATGPDDATASAAAVGGIRRWLEGVGAVAHRG
jgi:hypothetical protein